jgi:membrane AbrB-like protein
MTRAASWRGIGGLAVGALAGWGFSVLHSPLPWMIGPLVTLAALRVAGAPLTAPRGARQTGQWIIGTGLGLYFTPAVVHAVAGLWPLLVAAAVFAIVVGYGCGLALARLAGVDRTTAIFASVPGGAAEMSTLGERFGARVDQVAAAQSLRILMVVVAVPYGFALAGVHGVDPYVPGTTQVVPAGLVMLLASTLAGGFVARWLRVPNAFVLGALAVAIPLTAMRVDLSALPGALSASAQWLLGCALASRFGPEFRRGAHRFIGGVVSTVLLAIAASVAFGLALGWVSGQPAPTVILGLAPGGIAEMCLTARALSLGVPLVTACHVTRVVALLLLTAPLFERVRTLRRRGAGDPT